MRKVLLLVGSHLLAAVSGFVVGIYALPILIAPESPSMAQVEAERNEARYTGEFRRDLEGSDLFHWGEGTVWVRKGSIAFQGELAPGPDYKLYLSPEFVETAAGFERVKSRMVRIGDVKSFDRFILPMPESVDLEEFSAVIVWCESFSRFITAADYRHR